MPIDKENMLKVLEDFVFQFREALELPRGISVSKEFENIVVTGMGGSAIVGDLLKTYMHDIPVPVHVNRDYKMPAFVNKKTLVFAVSYSGNTEETISSVEDAIDKEANVIAITTGGQLKEMCESVVEIPKGFQPRAALGYLFLPMVGILHNTGIVDIKNEELNEIITILKRKEEYKEKGEELAKKIKDRLPVIYSSELFSVAAYRFKTQINENAKYPAFTSIFPEMNHNEINALGGMDRKRDFAIVIRDEKDHPRIKKRIDICKSLMEQRVDVEEIKTEGKSLLARIFSIIYLGDFTSYYLAIRNRVDPTPVEIIEKLKLKLKE